MTIPLSRRAFLGGLACLVSAPTMALHPSAAAAPIPVMAEAEYDILCRTVWGEARSLGLPGMRAICAVILRRVALPQFPNTISAVCLQKSQFSVWMAGDPNRAKMRKVTTADPSFVLAMQACTEIVTGRAKSPVGLADHFHSGRKPRWAIGRKPVAVLGKLSFYRLF